MNEIFYALFGRVWFGKFLIAKIDFFNEGSPTSVEFDYSSVSDKVNQGHNLLGFYHTHPNMPAYMSDTDIRTMDNWTCSEGTRLYSLIDGNDGIKVFDCYQDQDMVFHYYIVGFDCSVFSIPFIGNFIFGWKK